MYRGSYFLLEAFELLGSHLYPKSWNGYELEQKPPQPLGRIGEDIEQGEREIADLKESIASVDKSRAETTVDAEIQKLRADATALQLMLSQKMRDIAQLKSDAAYSAEISQVYGRRQETQRRLFEALTQRKIEGQFRNGAVLPTLLWTGAPMHRVDIRLSRARVPEYVSVGNRLDLVFIRGKEFDEWLPTQKPFEIAEHANRLLSPELQFENYLRAQVAAGPKKWPRDIYISEANIPRLSGKAAKRIWDKVVPDSWKRGGRPSGK